MQCKSYFLGLHTSRDLNVDTNGSNRPPYNVDRALENVFSYNGFKQPPVQDRELLYGKEVIKQTILKHETIFRDQVLELHRLYKRQTDIMDEIRSKQLHEYHIQLKTSQLNAIHSEVSFEYSQKALNFPSLPWVNPNCSRPSVSGADIIQPLLSYVEGKTRQIGQDFSQTEASLEDSKLLKSKGKKFQKKMLDLQLPASEYMDSEEGESFEEEKVLGVPEELKYSLKKTSEVFPMTDTKLLDNSGGLNHVCLGNAPSCTSSLSKITGLFDLNEPLPLEEVASPNSFDFVAPISKDSKIPCQDLSKNTSTSYQVLSQNTRTISDLEACSNNLDKDKKENPLESQTCNDEAGENMSGLNSFGQGFGSEQLSTSSKSSQVGPSEARELAVSLLLDQSNRTSWDERKNLGTEVSDRKHHVLKDNYPKRIGVSNSPESYQLVPYIANSESSSASSWRKSIRNVKRNPIAIQALPCFNSLTASKSSKSSVGSSGLIGDKRKLNKRMRYSPSSTNVSSLENGPCHGSLLKSKTLEACSTSTKFNFLKRNNSNDSESIDLKLAKDVNLNFMHPTCSPVEVVCQQDTPNVDGEKNVEDPLGGLSWLRKNSFYGGKPRKRRQYSNSLRSDSLHAFSSCISGVGQKKVEVGNCQSNQCTHSGRFSSCTSPSGSNWNLIEVEDTENIEEIGVIDINLVCDPTPRSGKQLTADNLVMKTGRHKELSAIGDPMNFASQINECKSSSKFFIPRDIKSAEKIDLEAPLSPENEECSPPRGKSDENELETPFQFSGLADEDPRKKLVRLAAEAIVSISSIGFEICSKSATCESSEASSADSLHWFAGIASSIACGSENEFSGKDGDEDSSNDAFDYFEVMTLKLSETKIEEYWLNSNGQKEEETDATLVPRQQRKGRARRGRQLKDFQREVLPCLASLSRYEVTEDLQTIEGLMEAAGASRKTGLARRHAGRNGWSRGRRRSCVPASYVEESTLCHALKQQSKNGEVSIEERSLTAGWGKITRRRRGQRCPATNLPLILSQV